MSPRTYRPGDPEYFHATSPDSDAREVCGTDWNVYLGPHYPCALPRGHDGPHKAGTQPATIVPVVISLDLAQRILALLDGPAMPEPKERAAMVNELRAVIGK